MPLDILFRILSTSLAPMILISGVGLLVLSMTNRFGRVIDRARHTAREIEQGAEGSRRDMLHEQLEVLYRRGRIMRGSILFTSAAVLCVSIGALGALGFRCGASSPSGRPVAPFIGALASGKNLPDIFPRFIPCSTGTGIETMHGG